MKPSLYTRRAFILFKGLKENEDESNKKMDGRYAYMEHNVK